MDFKLHSAVKYNPFFLQVCRVEKVNSGESVSMLFKCHIGDTAVLLQSFGSRLDQKHNDSYNVTLSTNTLKDKLKQLCFCAYTRFSQMKRVDTWDYGKRSFIPAYSKPMKYFSVYLQKHNTRIKKRKLTHHKWSPTYCHKTENMIQFTNASSCTPTYGFKLTQKQIKTSLFSCDGASSVHPSLLLYLSPNFF